MKYLIMVYIIFWIILSERLTLESIIVGALICSLVSYFNREPKRKNSQGRISNLMKVKLWIIYIFVLLKEIVISNFHVAKIVLSPHIKISPRVITFETDIKSDLNKTILANSITLTPGTLIIGIDERKLTVHCLDERYTDGVTETDFEKLIMKVEG